MVFLALSWLSQKDGSPILSVSWVRSACLPATSKRVPQLGQTAGQVIDAAAQVGVHRSLRDGHSRSGSMAAIISGSMAAIITGGAENDDSA